MAAAADDRVGEEGLEQYKVDGYHRVSIGEVYDGGRYTVIKKLGWGHFSTVWLVDDATQPEGSPLRRVALKVQKSARRYTSAAKDEIKLLQCVNENAATSASPVRIVKMLNSFEHSGPHGTHTCFVFEVLGDNLLNVIKHYNYEGLPIKVVKLMAYQILEGLDFLHRICGIIHTDLKPENVLIGAPRDDRSTKAPTAAAGAMATVEATMAGLSLEGSAAKAFDDALSATAPMGFRAVADSADRAVKEVEATTAALEALSVETSAVDVVDTSSPSNLAGSGTTMVNAVPQTPDQLKASTQLEEVELKLKGKMSPSARKRLKRKRTKLKRMIAGSEGSSGGGSSGGAASSGAGSSGGRSSGGRSSGGGSSGGGSNGSAASAAAAPAAAKRGGSGAPASAPAPTISPYFTAEDEVNIKIVDLGNACWVRRHFSEDIQTRQYRCPEVRAGCLWLCMRTRAEQTRAREIVCVRGCVLCASCCSPLRSLSSSSAALPPSSPHPYFRLF